MLKAKKVSFFCIKVLIRENTILKDKFLHILTNNLFHLFPKKNLLKSKMILSIAILLFLLQILMINLILI